MSTNQGLQFREQGPPEAYVAYGYILFSVGSGENEVFHIWEPIKVDKQLFFPPLAMQDSNSVNVYLDVAPGNSIEISSVDTPGETPKQPKKEKKDNTK